MIENVSTVQLADLSDNKNTTTIRLECFLLPVVQICCRLRKESNGFWVNEVINYHPSFIIVIDDP